MEQDITIEKMLKRPETAALESQLVSAFRAAALPDNETLDLRQPSPLSPGADSHGHHHHQHHHHHHPHHHHSGAGPLALPDYSRKRSHRHTDLPSFFQGGTPGGEMVPGPKKAKFSAAATAAAAAVAANYYDNAYLSFEKSLRGAFGGVDGMAGGSMLDGPGGNGGGAGGVGGVGGGTEPGAGGGLDPYGGGHHLLSPINYTLTAEAINRRIRSTLGLDDQDQMERALAMNNGSKGTPDECCPGMASPDWMLRRSGSGSAGGPALADTRVYTHSPLPPGTPGTLYEEHKFAPFSPTSSTAMHDDNNNVDKKAFQE
ncbi:AT-rich interactive domain-containing protein 1B-like [Anopheles marshallii]|uniref:AT-rich interactive domain-containing protein 1B-like n=1 Tax=Anopheles marshallii TaxID=1521116 RepID=UPI00237A4243|nr:AT-rich interactive domain-containing protein 1B-like [Anopheles marshallii]